MIPVAAPTRLSVNERDGIIAGVTSVVDCDRWIGGAMVERFERDFADYTISEHVVGVGNGTDALCIALLALDLPPGSGLLVPANDGGYAATAARMVGLEPIAMDIDESTLVPTASTASRAESAHRGSFSAIVVTHLHGNVTPLAAIDEWRKAAGLALIEDCSQAHGAPGIGTFGDAAAYSFYPTKNLGAIGDAGAVTFSSLGLAERARSIREYGWEKERFRSMLSGGRNSRLDPVQAAVLLARLPFLDERNERRRAIRDSYAKALSGGEDRVAGELGAGVAHHAVVVSARRDELANFLAKNEIDSQIHYPYLVQEMPGLAAIGDTPVAAAVREQILSIPCFPEMSDGEVGRVKSALSAWQDGSARDF